MLFSYPIAPIRGMGFVSGTDDKRSAISDGLEVTPWGFTLVLHGRAIHRVVVPVLATHYGKRRTVPQQRHSESELMRPRR
jgi:hypothetical protein